jgi:bacteriorhodopsin
MGFFALLGLIAWAILMVLIFKKAGYSGLQIIFLFIPLVNVIVFVWFALTEWPIEKELKEMKARLVFTGKDTSFRNSH